MRSLRHDQIFGHAALLPAWSTDMFLDQVVPEDRDAAKDAFARANTTGLLDLHCRIRWPDQSVHWIVARGRVFHDAAGVPARVLGVVADATARKQLEQALAARESEVRQRTAQLKRDRERLIAAQAVAGVGSWETDAVTLAVIWSDETHRIFETDPASFAPTHQAFLEFVHPEDRERVNAAFAESLAEGKRGFVEHRVLLPDGRIKIVEERWQGFADDAGTPLYAIGTCQDITDRRRGESAQRAIYRIAEAAAASGTLQEMLAAVHRIVAELMPVPNFYIALHDPATQRVEFPYYVDERGDVPAGPEPLGRGVTAYVLRTGRPLALGSYAQFEALVRAGEVVQIGAPSLSWIGVPLRTRDRTVGVLAAQIYEGATRYGPAHTELLTFVSTQVARAIERKQGEEALGASERRFRALISNSADGILVLDAHGAASFRSASAAQILGDGAGRSGGSVLEQVHPADRAHLEQVWAQALERPGVPVAAVARVRDGSGAWRELDGVLVNRLADPAVGGVVGNFRDVTERRQMEARLMIADRMMSVGTLAAGVAHEINNPLAYVIANLAFAREQVDEVAHGTGVAEATRLAALHEVTDALREAELGATRVRGIVRDLNTLSRPDQPGSVGPVDLHRVLDLSLGMAWNEIRHRARLVKDYALDLPRVTGDEGRLGQVFLNLLINAAQAIREGSANSNEIRLTTRAEGGCAVIEVRDTGSGITPEHRKRLFDPFFTTKPQGVGTGLGLSICRNILVRLGGTIDVESEVGKGSVFRVSLPISEEEVPPAEPPAIAPAASGARGRILVIDDEPLVARGIVRALQGQHEVVAITRAPEALELLRGTAPFDLILCDLMMPEMSGIEFFGQLARELPAEAAKIVFLTGGAFTERAKEFLGRVSNRVLAKPCDVADLRGLIEARLTG